MSDIIKYYPEPLRNKVKILYFDDMNMPEWHVTGKGNGWRLHAYMKLYLANLTEADYYCMLDAKNHFIRNVKKSDFFTDDGKYYIFTTPTQCAWARGLYENSFNYFHLNPNLPEGRGLLDNYSDSLVSIGTPFIYESAVNKSLADYEGHKNMPLLYENASPFECFYFAGELKHVECSIYLAFIFYLNKNNFKFKDIIHTTIHKDPNEEWAKSFIEKKVYLEDRWKVLGIHRLAPDKMSLEYKKSALNMYKTFYDEKIIKFISSEILNK
jgi:hypothetical protein